MHYKYELDYCTHLLSAFKTSTFELVSLIERVPELTEPALLTIQKLWGYYDTLIRVVLCSVDSKNQLICSLYKQKFRDHLMNLSSAKQEVIYTVYKQMYSECFHFINLKKILPYTSEITLQIARHMRFSSLFLTGNTSAPILSDSRRLQRVLFGDTVVVDRNRMRKRSDAVTSPQLILPLSTGLV